MIHFIPGTRNLLFFLILIISLPTLGQEVMFTVDGTPAYTDEFEYVYKKNSQNNPEAFTKEDLDDYFKLFVNFKLKVREAHKQGLDADSSLIKEFESYKVQLQKPYLTNQQITDQLVKEAYDRLYTEVRAAHILIRVAPNASPADTLTAYNKIMGIRNQATGSNFGTLARNFSEDPGGKVNGGDLGYFTSMQMVYPFEDAAFNTEVGQISAPIRTQFGYHLIKVNEKRKSQGKIQVAHIMIRFQRGMTSADSLAKKQKIFDIADQLSQGFEWDELCRLYSEDPSSKERGGLLQPFRTGNFPATFSEAGMALFKPGDISDPVMTQFGWHILKLVDKLGVEPLEEVEPTILARINSDSRSEIKEQALVEKLIIENSVILDEENIAKAEAGNELVDSDPLITIGSNVFTYSDFVASGRGKTLNEFISSTVIEDEEDRLVDKYPEYGFLLKEYWEGILLFQVMDQEVWKKAVTDSTGLTSFFNARRDKYQWKKRVEADIYASQSNITLDSVAAMLDRGNSKREIITRLNPKAKATLRHQEGNFEVGSTVLPEAFEWKTGRQRVKDESIYYLFDVKAILPPGNQELDETRGQVISDYQDELEKEWVEQLRSRYDVKINKKTVKNVYKKLMQ